MSLEENTNQNDSIAINLRASAQNILLVIFGLLPLLFIPNIVAPFDYTKVLVIVVGVFLALILYSLSVLRSGTIAIGISYPLCALWVIVAIASISSILSGDFKDSFMGDFFSTHATAFLCILALIPTVWFMLKPTKGAVIRLYMLLALSTTVLVVFHFLRIAFGADVLTLGVFTGPTATPVGSWNDLGLLLGLTVLFSLIALDQLSLTKTGRFFFAGVIVAALFMLSVINFFIIWIILGVASLVMIVYSLGKERFTGGQLALVKQQTINVTALNTTFVVFIASVLFVIGGATFGGFVSKYTNISYIEVRPSFEATADIARNVYQDNALLGIGTNKFSDAWRLYKDPSINTTVFWNTDFIAGSGYITTFFVTTGVLGGIAWTVFLVLYCVIGLRKLLNTSSSDRVWYFIGVSSFVSALYVWGISVVYVPGVVMLLLGALFTGVSLVAFNALDTTPSRLVTVGANRRTGFLLTFTVIIVIMVSVGILYNVARHYSSIYTFNESIRAMQQGESIDVLERKVQNAYQLSMSDIYARRIAEYQLSRMNSLVLVSEPTEEDQLQFQNASLLGVSAAQRAIQIDSQDAANWSILAGIYSVLASVGVDGAHEESLKALTKVRELNPTNPLPYLESAIVEGRVGNFDSARSFIQQAITLKPNFTEAFFLLTQLEIATGNVEAAINSTQAVIILEPRNPARYYQLGILESSRANFEGAALAFERAVALDQNYANARYLLALTYDELGRGDDARTQLEVVLNLNPGNTEVTTLLEVLNQEGSLESLRENTSRTVGETVPVVDESGTVITTTNVDTTLINPVNTVPSVDSVNQ